MARTAPRTAARLSNAAPPQRIGGFAAGKFGETVVGQCGESGPTGSDSVPLMPLAGRRFVVAGAGPIADEGAALLHALDAEVVRVARVTPGLVAAGAEGALDATATLAA